MPLPERLLRVRLMMDSFCNCDQDAGTDPADACSVTDTLALPRAGSSAQTSVVELLS